jgi:hypothetical protein
MMYPLGLAGKLLQFSGADGYKDRWVKLTKAMEKFRDIFGGNE